MDHDDAHMESRAHGQKGAAVTVLQTLLNGIDISSDTGLTELTINDELSEMSLARTSYRKGSCGGLGLV